MLASHSAREWRSLISVQDISNMLGIDAMLDIRDTLAATGVSKGKGRGGEDGAMRDWTERGEAICCFFWHKLHTHFSSILFHRGEGLEP